MCIKTLFRESLRAFALFMFFFPARWLLLRLSHRSALKIAAMLGTIHGMFLPDAFSRRIRQGIRAAQPDIPKRELERLVRRNLITRYKYRMDLFFIPGLDENLITDTVPVIRNKHCLDEILAMKKGAILLASHFGSYAMLVAGFSYRGYKITKLMTMNPEPAFRTWPIVERAVIKIKMACWKQENVCYMHWKPGVDLKPLFEELLKGGLQVLHGDGSRGRAFAEVDFLGNKLLVSTGPYLTAAKAGIPLIPAFIVRRPDDRHEIILEKPILIENADEESLRACAKIYASLLSGYVRKHPDHWFSWARVTRDAGDVLRLAPAEIDPSDFYSEEEFCEK